MGKTALAAAFAERFAWRWPHGVLGISFAGSEPLSADFRTELIRGLLGPDTATKSADIPVKAQNQLLLDTLKTWQGLLLLDNYESILQNLAEDSETTGNELHVEAEAIQRLVYQIAEGGGDLLLTSRQHPAGLPGEDTYPRRSSLRGIRETPAVQLFFRHSTKANSKDSAHETLAQQIALVTRRPPPGHCPAGRRIR